MSEKLYTSGEVLGITGLKRCTMQRYIRTWRDFFSPSARKPGRSRRYTGQDIKQLFLIRYLHSQRESGDRITQALRGEWVPEVLPWIELTDAIEIAQAAMRLTSRAERAANEIKRQAEIIRDSNNERIKLPRQEIKVINDLNARFIKLEREFKSFKIARAEFDNLVKTGRLSHEQRKILLHHYMQEQYTRDDDNPN